MELSKPHLQVSDFSLPNSSDSQILGSLNSLSIPSEPPELGNWFPSYQYESPLPETIDNFEDSLSEKSEIGKDKSFIDDTEKEKEENLMVFKEIEEKNEVLVGLKLKSNEFSECSRSFEDGESENQSLSENIDSTYSASLPSEPISIRNWFSSYVYESPTLDTNDGFRDSLSKESECEEGGFIVEESNRDKAEDDCGLFRRIRRRDDAENSNGLGNCDKTCQDNKHEKQTSNKDDPTSGGSSQILSGKSVITFGSALKQCSKYETLQNQRIGPAKDVELPNLDQEDPECKLNFSDEVRIGPLSVHGSKCNRDKEPSQKLIHRMENVKDSEANDPREAASLLSPEGYLKSVMVNGSSNKKSTHGCDKENEGKEISKDGFVTTRKGRLTMENEENLIEMPKQNKKVTIGKGSVVERKALAERTNFNFSGVTGITGKWQCPQKRKPDLGPPLKQLRLEKWVHRL